MKDAALQLEGIGKRYHRRTSLRGMLTELAGLAEGPDAFWALRDVNLSVARGECMGIVGHNGAGKSTLLKILSRITPPTTGRYRLAGRLGSLIEVGAGFHPELTGRENVFLAGAIHGMRRRELEDKFDAIVEFSGLREFMDMPVKRYSSGMFVRLGFSVAVHTQPDVLLVDEVLAVGDRPFQMRCYQRFRELLKSGCAVVLVSHNLAIISRQCDRVALLDRGRLGAQGEPADVLDRYRGQPDGRAPGTFGELENIQHPEIAIEGVDAFDAEGRPAGRFELGSRMRLRMHYLAKREFAAPAFAFGILDEVGRQITAFRTDMSEVTLPAIDAGRGVIDVDVETLNLLPGEYRISARVLDGPTGACYCRREGLGGFQVSGGHLVEGICYLPHRWRAPDRETAQTESSEVGPKLDRPIFLTGCGKSGTTVLSLLFSFHPDVGPPAPWRERFSTPQAFLDAMLEDESFDEVAHRIERKDVWDAYFPNKVPLRVGKELTLLKNPLTPERTRALVGDLTVGFAQRRYFSKHPSNAMRLHVLREIFPDAKLIAIHRDGRDVAASWGRKHDRWRSQGGFDAAIRTFARKWNETVDHVEAYREALDVYVLRYEDLVRTPVPVLRDLFAWCGLAFDERLYGDLRIRDRTGRWRELIPAEHHALVEDLTRHNRERLGYAGEAGAKLR